MESENMIKITYLVGLIHSLPVLVRLLLKYEQVEKDRFLGHREILACLGTTGVGPCTGV